MGEQLGLFEQSKGLWVKRLWQAMPPEVRVEVIEVLAQTGKAALEAAQSTRLKEAGDES